MKTIVKIIAAVFMVAVAVAATTLVVRRRPRAVAQTVTAKPVPATAPPGATPSAPTASAPPTIPAASSNAPQIELAAMLAGLGSNDGSAYDSSGIVDHDGVLWTAIAIPSTDTQGAVDINVYRWFGSWVSEATVRLPPGEDTGMVNGPDNISTAPLTPVAAPVFVLTMAEGDHVQIAVISETQGSWMAVPFDTADGSHLSVPDGQVKGSEIRSDVNNCVPNCSQGSYTYTYYRYAQGAFVPAYS
jgi:hypothetical protein